MEPTESPVHATLEDAYDSEIAPLMTQVIDACKRHGIPVLATFALDLTHDDPEDPNKRLCCTTFIPGEQPWPEGFRDAANVIMHGWHSPQPAFVALTVRRASDGPEL